MFEKSINSSSKGYQYFDPYGDQDFEDLLYEMPNVKDHVLIYKREYDNFSPTLHSWYFFDKDSTIKWIIYNWGFANTKIEANNDELKKQTSRLKDYKNKYKREKENLIRIIGKLTKEDLKVESSAYLNIITIWDHADKRVVLNMTVDKNVIELNNKVVKKSIVIPRSKIQIKIMIKE